MTTENTAKKITESAQDQKKAASAPNETAATSEKKIESVEKKSEAKTPTAESPKEIEPAKAQPEIVFQESGFFRKARKEKSRLRLAIYGPSGSGKTFSALRIATGFDGRVAFIDTEHGSSSKYADRFDFDIAEIASPFAVKDYLEAIRNAGEAGYEVLVIDSLSHAWQWLLSHVDQLASKEFIGNTKGAWLKGTPLHVQLLSAIFESPCHIIVTMRSKTEWSVERDEKSGKAKPSRVGTSPEQRAGVEYEFDFLLEGTTDHVFNISKDRTGKYQDHFLIPDEEFGTSLARWLDEGIEPERRPTNDPEKNNRLVILNGYNQFKDRVQFSDSVVAGIANINLLDRNELEALYALVRTEIERHKKSSKTKVAVA